MEEMRTSILGIYEEVENVSDGNTVISKSFAWISYLEPACWLKLTHLLVSSARIFALAVLASFQARFARLAKEF